jgi:hypothetical protein
VAADDAAAVELPMMLPLWNRLPDLAAVYLRLFFVR